MIMSEQYLQYIRECFMMATADTSGKTKGSYRHSLNQRKYALRG